MAQLTAQLLVILENPGSNPVISNFNWTIIYCWLFLEKSKVKKKSPREWPIYKRKNFRTVLAKASKPNTVKFKSPFVSFYSSLTKLVSSVLDTWYLVVLN